MFHDSFLIQVGLCSCLRLYSDFNRKET